MEKIKVLIIGSGPAGFTSAIYTSRANLSPVLYEGIEPGGQLTTTTEIENFPGYPEGITGSAMMEDLRKQDVAVVGGGDTACEEATYLASICRKVYLIVRKNYLRASKAMQERVFNTPNIEVLFEHNTAEVLGDDEGVTGVRVVSTAGEERTIPIMGFFLAIGHHPNTEVFKGQLELDEQGYIKVVPGTSKTSVEGVFAAGDVKDPHYRQAITAAGSGCIAALDCERFLLAQ